MDSTETKNGDAWAQQLLSKLDEMDGKLESLREWRSKHMNECHPALLQTDAKMEGRWAIVAGFCFGIGLALGYCLTRLLDKFLA